MNQTTEKPLDYLDAPIEAKKWKNLWFDKSGNSYFGCVVYASEEEARKVADYVASRLMHHGILIAEDGSWGFPSKNYSHTLQIPWKE